MKKKNTTVWNDCEKNGKSCKKMTIFLAGDTPKVIVKRNSIESSREKKGRIIDQSRKKVYKTAKQKLVP